MIETNMQPVSARLVLALLITISGGSYAYVHGQHENEAMTTQQAEQLGGLRSQLEQSYERCNELRIKDLRDDFKGVRDVH